MSDKPEYAWITENHEGKLIVSTEKPTNKNEWCKYVKFSVAERAGKVYVEDTARLTDRIEALEAENARLREHTRANRLLEWISYHHLPLQLWREDDGQWVVVDGSTNHVLGSGEDAESAIRAALSADKTKEE